MEEEAEAAAADDVFPPPSFAGDATETRILSRRVNESLMDMSSRRPPGRLEGKPEGDRGT